MNEFLLTAEDLHFAYVKSSPTLDGLSMAVHKGEKLVILGRNGVGKTTLLHVLAGLHTPSYGKIKMNGEVFEHNDAALKRRRQLIAMVFQNADDQLFAPTVAQDVSFGPVNLGLGKEELQARVSLAMHALEIEHLSDRAPHLLSGGEKKRAALAGAMAMNPKLLLLDEPTTALDPEAQRGLRSSLDMLNHNGVTMIASTHDLNFAWLWADRAAIMHEGKIAAIGDAHTLLSDEMLLSTCGLRPCILARLSALAANSNAVLSEQLQKIIDDAF